jgi:tetratricopeptide (TPR) repeat protein
MARILNFPQYRTVSEMAPDEALATAKEYFESSVDERVCRNEEVLTNPDVLVALFGVLRDSWETCPESVADTAVEINVALTKANGKVGLFDERQYFLGESALVAATAFRFLGKNENARRWLDRADMAFRKTINPAPALANVSYARMTIGFVEGRFEDLLEMLPVLGQDYRDLRMRLEADKCEFLLARTLLGVGKKDEAVERLEQLSLSADLPSDAALYGNVLTYLGNSYSEAGRYEDAAHAYGLALPAVSKSGRVAVTAQLKWSFGDTSRSLGKLEEAVSLYRAAQHDFAKAGMGNYVAMLHLVNGESLLRLNRPREAEWEILAALPTIEEQKMVPEGFAAVALLKESVRRRKTDPNALRELREHLQKQN